MTGFRPILSLSQPQEAAEAEPQSAPQEAGNYTPEQAAERYGTSAVESLAEKGVDLGELMSQADQGQDISKHYEALAETFNTSKEVVEMFEQKQHQPVDPLAKDGMSDADSMSILNEVGGQEAFDALQAWGKNNMSAAEKASYNAAVDTGNAEAVRWALRSLQARQGLIQQDVEPQLYGGGTPAKSNRVFESQQQLLDAMNKRNDMGQRYYDVDEAYRSEVKRILEVSPDF